MNPIFDNGAPVALAFLFCCLVVLFIWCYLTASVTDLAQAKGRNQWLWALMAFFVITPVAALVALHCMTPNEAKLVDSEKAQLCPYCVSLVDVRARRCPKCCADIAR
jgi:hypothetical protein